MFETLAALAKKEFGKDSLAGKFVLTAGMGGMSGAQPMAATLNDGHSGVEIRPERIKRKIAQGYCDRMTADLKEALGWIEESKRKGLPLSVGLVGNAAEIHSQLVRMGVVPDIVTDQTPAHDIWSYVPEGELNAMEELRRNNPADYKRRAYESIVKHVEAILEMQRRGAICFDYGQQSAAAGRDWRVESKR